MTDFNNKYIKHCQLEKIKQKINKLYKLIEDYVDGATEEEKQAIPLYRDCKGNKGLVDLLRGFKLVYLDWIDREDFQYRYNVKPEYIDEVMNRLDDNCWVYEITESVIEDVINEIETENEG